MPRLRHALPRSYIRSIGNGPFPLQIMQLTCTISCYWLQVKKDKNQTMLDNVQIQISQNWPTFKCEIGFCSSLPICSIGCARWLRNNHLSWSLSTEKREKGKSTIMHYRHCFSFRNRPQFEVILQCFAFRSHVTIGHAVVPGKPQHIAALFL